jgi:SAM-dependent methyltransferase
MTAPSAQYFTTRFAPDPRRAALWRHLTRELSRRAAPGGAVLELGAGYCHFINGISAERRVAVDLGEQVVHCAAPGVEAINADVLEYLCATPDASFDFVFASNFLEHFEWPVLIRIIAEIRRIMRPKARLALVQPNFRLAPGRYFDDYTHRTVFSDVSLCDWVSASGFHVVECVPRFLPLTVKSRLGHFSFLIPLYLRLPWRPFAGQMFVLAERINGKISSSFQRD